MIECSDAINGIGLYLHTKIIPRLDGKRQFAAGVLCGLISRKAETIVRELSSNQLVRTIGVISESGQIDIDAIYECAKAQIHTQQKLKIDIPMMGEFVFDENDIDEMYRFMKGDGPK